MKNLIYGDLTAQVLEVFFHVYNVLGYGFLEKVYENALLLSLKKKGLSPSRQVPIKVIFEGESVGEYFADLVVNEKVIVEVKASEAIHSANEAQLLNYLKATNIEVGLLLNFGKKPQFRRKFFTNNLK
jgi:GxxExxY protein